MKKIKNKIKQDNFYKKLAYSSILVKIVDPPSENIDIEEAISAIEEAIPYDLISGYVEEIIFGNFDFFKEKNFNAFYDKENKIIYIRSEAQSSQRDLLDDLIHELSHAIEKKFNMDIYSDGFLKAEFIKKRLKLFYSLIIDYGSEITADKFLMTSYDEELDSFFYKAVGYEKMKSYIGDIFPSTYAPTSISEYWAEGFEKYVLGDHDALRRCPRLYNKIDTLFKGE